MKQMSKPGCFLLMLCLILAPQLLHGQKPFFKRINPPRELSRQVITSLYQDQAGFIWLGTEHSLYKYTGTQYQPQISLDSTGSHAISCMFEDSQQRMWIGYENGVIGRLVDGSIMPIQQADSLTGAAITAIDMDSTGRLWVSTYGKGLFWYSDPHLHQVRGVDGFEDEDIYDMIIEGQKVYLATDAGVVILDTAGDSIFAERLTTKSGLPDNIINAFTRDNKGNIWMSSYDKGFCKYNLKSGTVDKPLTDWNYGTTHDLQWAADQLWLGTDNQGLIQYDPFSNAVIASQGDAMRTKKITKILLDKDHNLWLAHQDNYLSWVQPGLSFLEPSQDLAFQKISAVGHQDPHSLWFANDWGLHRYSIGNGQTTSFLKQQWPEIGPVNSLLVDSENNIWMGTWNGLYKYEADQNQLMHLTQLDGLVNNNVLSLAIADSTLWIATLGGVSRLNLNNKPLAFANYQDEALMGAGYVYQVFVDKQLRAWFGTDGNGLIMWDGHEFKSFASQQPESSLVIYGITADNLGNIWFTTPSEGVFSFNGTEFESYGTESGLRDLEIDAIALDSKGNLLMVHDNGFDLLNPKTKDIMYFGEESGIQNQQVNLNNLARDSYGNLWIGGDQGITRFHQWHEPSEMKPQTIIDKIAVFLENKNLTDGAVLKYHENHISFEYASNWYQNLGEVTYQTKLDGYDLDWNTKKSQVATYPKLTPGDYTFMVRSSINNQFDNAVISNFNFTIARPWWTQLWVLVLLGATITLGLVQFIKYREKKLRSEEQLKKDLIQTQLETLKSQVNPHFLFNSFNALAGIIEENSESAVSYVERLSDFFRSTLTFRDQQLITLQHELDLVNNYVYLQKQRYGDNLIVNISVPSEVKGLVLPPMTVQILVENAIKHNVVSTSRPLTIDIFHKQQYLIVRNNKQLKQSQQNSTGFGLYSIVNRYKLLGSSSISIDDVSDNNFQVGVPLLNELPS